MEVEGRWGMGCGGGGLGPGGAFNKISSIMAFCCPLLGLAINRYRFRPSFPYFQKLFLCN
jgi:hypothetical protein